MREPRPLSSKEQDIYMMPDSRQAMKGFAALLMILLLAMVMAPGAFCANIKGGDIFLVRPDSPYIDQGYVPPEYISVDDLDFYTCIEEKNIPVKSTVICLDDNSFEDIPMTRWLDTGNCYIGTYNLDDKDCRKMVIQSIYTKDQETVTLEKEIKVNRISSILDLVARNQYSDGGWKDAVGTAAGIWVLSTYPEIYADEIEMGLQWLKLNRNNDEKCWPNKDCSVTETAKILAYLTFSGINDTHRVMHDGLVYLENNQNFYQEGEVWNLSIKPFESGTTDCIISYENNLYNEDNFSMEEGRAVDYKISPVPAEKLYVICDQNFQANLTTPDNDQVFIYEGDNLSYTTPFNCWSKDKKWGECDLTTTLLATMTNISENNKELALEYLDSELRTERSGERYIGPDRNVTDTALYAYVRNNQNVTSWLRYKQNNDGSWGNGSEQDEIIPTGFNILGLMNSGFNRTNEVIRDAESWVNEKELEFSLNETAEYSAWNSTEKNAHAFIVLRNNARPAIKSDPMLIMIDKETTEVDIYNPTTFDLDDVSFEFSDNLKSHLEIDQRDEIPSYSYVKQDITKNTAETGNLYGYLYVKNHDVEIGKIPVMMTNFPKISMTSIDDRILVFGTKGTASFNVDKTSHVFTCSLSWDDPDISSQKDFTVNSNKLSVDIVFSSAERVEKTYAGTFNCSAADQSYDIPVSLTVSRYETFPFSVSPETIFVNDTGQDRYLVIQNLLDETLDVSLGFMKKEADFEISRQEVSIDPNDDVNITIYNNVPLQVNLTTSDIIEVTALGQKKDVNFRAAVVAVPVRRLSPLIFWLIIGLTVAVLGVLGYLGYSYREKITGLLKKGSKLDSVKVKIKKLEEKEKHTAIMNMVNILRILKKDDVQIRARLKQEGFLDDEVDKAFEMSSAEGSEGAEDSTEDDLFTKS